VVARLSGCGDQNSWSIQEI